jgi:hypothetical protein
MVSLGVAEEFSTPVEISMGKRKSLRDTALWYPKIPDPGLCLNDDCFTGENLSAAGYQPLCWALFGGPGGIYLRFLTEISVIFLGSLWSIEFHYNADEVPTEWCKVGRRKSTGYEQVMRFPVDGPGGEIIETIEANLEYSYSEQVYSFYRHGKLRSFKVS